MKLIACAAIPIALVLSCRAAAQGELPANELFPNGSFEQLRADRPAPVHWSFFRTDGIVTTEVDTEVARDGSTSVRLHSDDTTKRAGWSRSAVRGPGVAPGRVILFAGHYRTDNVRPGQHLGVCARLTFVNTDGTVQATHYGKGGDGTANWRRTEALLTLPDNILRIHPVLFLYGSGTLWWDAVSLRSYDPDLAVQLVTPQPDACVPEPRPEFSWTAVPDAVAYTLELSTTANFDVDCTERIAVLTDPRVRPQKSLTPGTVYHWRVRARMRDGSERISLLKDGQTYRFHTLYAGSWADRSKPAGDKIAHYRRVYAKLVRFAEQNRMWEPFLRLKDGISRLERITAAATPEALSAIATLETDFADLDRFIAWWEMMFLNDEAFLDTLDYSRPGLEKAQTAWTKRDVGETLTELLAYFRTRRRPVCFFDTENRPPPLPDGAETRVVPGADQLCRHLYPIPEKLYGKKLFDFGPGFNWHINPIVDREWPTRIHRHKQWQDICDAYWISYNEKYAEQWRQQLLDWAKDNPIERWNPRTKRMCWSTLNAAARMIHRWPPALLQLRGSKAFDETTLLVFLKGIQQHGRFLMEKQAGGGNWVIQEAKAQLMMGMFFPELKEAEQWLERGIARTRQELDNQVFDDGIHIERTPGYHGGCLESFVSVLQLLELNKLDFDGRDHFLQKIEKMYDFCLYGIKPDGTMPVLGDMGKARYRPFLEKGHKRFHRLDFLYVATEGKQGVEPVRTSHVFPDAGLYAMRSDWKDENALYMFLDAGGYYGHCHLDNLTFELYAYGRTLLAEAGRYAYAADINQYFRGTIGHNTILVDRQNMQRTPAPECRTWIATPQFDYLHVLHRAYPGLTHERRVLFIKPTGPGADGYWVVVDDVLGTGNRRCDQRFHFEPELTAEFSGLQARSVNDDGANLLIAAPSNSAGLALVREDGWVSYKWYGKRPTSVAQFTRDGPLPAHFDTILFPQRPGKRVSLQVRRLPVDGHVALRVDGTGAGPAFSDLILLRNTPGAAPVAIEGCRTDARVAYLRCDATGTPLRALLHAGASLEFGGRTLLRAGEATRYAAASWTGSSTLVDGAAVEILEVHYPADTAQLEVNGNSMQPEKIAQVSSGATVTLRDVAPRPERSLPREPGPPSIAYEPPESRETLTTLLAHRLPADPAAHAAPAKFLSASSHLLIEAETFAAEDGGKLQVSSRKVNASGNAILRWDRYGHWIEWKFTAPAAADYALALRVATHHGRVLRRIEIDGKIPDKRLGAVEFGYTGGWATHQDDWCMFTVGTDPKRPVRLHLDAGEHTLRLTNLKGSLNVDYLLFTPLQ